MVTTAGAIRSGSNRVTVSGEPFGAAARPGRSRGRKSGDETGDEAMTSLGLADRPHDSTTRKGAKEWAIRSARSRTEPGNEWRRNKQSLGARGTGCRSMGLRPGYPIKTATPQAA